MNILLEKLWDATVTLLQWVFGAILALVFNYIFYSPYF